MKLFVIAFLVLSVGLAVQSLSGDDNETRPSLRTFLLFYLLQSQNTTTSATSTRPYNTSILINNATNTSGISLTVPRMIRLTKLDIENGRNDTETYYVPNEYYDMVNNIAEEYSQQVGDIEVVTGAAVNETFEDNFTE